MTRLIALLAAIASLLIVIGVHEAAHALVARWFGVTIKRIAIGFGKPILRWSTPAGMEWALGWCPFGGYVELLNSRIHAVTAQDKPHCFDQRSIAVRGCILLAGILANLIFAWLLLTIIFSVGYLQVSPVIAEVRPHSIAAQAHLLAGDQIIRIANQPTPSWQAVGMQWVRALGNNRVSIEVQDDQGHRSIKMLNLHQRTALRSSKNWLSSLGIIPNSSSQYRHSIAGLPLEAAMQQAYQACYEQLSFFAIMLKQLITGVLPLTFLLGPLSFFMLMFQSFLQSVTVFLLLLAYWSLAVALINSCPLPSLDGGSLFYLLLEKIRGRPLAIATEILCYRFAIIAFGLILVQLLANDLQP